MSSLSHLVPNRLPEEYEYREMSQSSRSSSSAFKDEIFQRDEFLGTNRYGIIIFLSPEQLVLPKSCFIESLYLQLD